MRRLLTGDEMVELERYAMRKQGLTTDDLMERAAQAVADRAAELAPDGPVVIVAGKGNNGGDGRVAARILESRGIPVRLVDLAEERDTEAVKRRLAEALDGARVVVDAVFGFSLRGPPRPPTGEVLDAISDCREQGSTVLAVDMPSGVESHSGHIHGSAVTADETLTFTVPKLGLVLEPGRSHAGQVTVVDIGIDGERAAKSGQAFELGPSEVRALLPDRPVDCHKKSCGRVLVIGGSQGMSGAPCLTAEAALRAGAGTVHLAVPASLVAVVETKLTEPITIPLSETFARSIDSMAVDAVLEMLSEFDVLALGPGLSLQDSTIEFVQEVVAAADLPLVLDADGLNAVVGHTDLLSSRSQPTVITPHPGELARLAASTTDEVQHDRPGFVQAAAEDWGTIAVLKGAPTLISDGNTMVVNPTGNAGMATMGMGDVLTGLIAGLMAQDVAPSEAAQAATWLHGAAGDEAAAKLTQYCLLAGDVLAELPGAFGRLVKAEGGSDGHHSP